MCHYHQTSPNSHFTKKRFISLPTKNGSIMIVGNKLIKKKKGKEKKVKLKNESAFKKALLKYFKVKI